MRILVSIIVEITRLNSRKIPGIQLRYFFFFLSSSFSLGLNLKTATNVERNLHRLGMLITAVSLGARDFCISVLQIDALYIYRDACGGFRRKLRFSVRVLFSVPVTVHVKPVRPFQLISARLRSGCTRNACERYTARDRSLSEDGSLAKFTPDLANARYLNSPPARNARLPPWSFTFLPA